MVLLWPWSFLEERDQKAVLEDSYLKPWPLTCGVPQGSVLFQMVFNIYTKPLGEIIQSFGVRCHQYMDDTQP